MLVWGFIWVAIDSPPANDMISDVPRSPIGMFVGRIGELLIPVAILIDIAAIVQRFLRRSAC